MKKQVGIENTNGKVVMTSLQADGKMNIYFYDEYEIMFSVNFINVEKAFNGYIVNLIKELGFTESELCELYAGLLNVPFMHVFRRFNKFF